jgi:hypothetical protein
MPSRPPCRSRLALLLGGVMAGLGAPLLVQAAPARAAMPQPANLQPPAGAIAQATPTLSPVLLQALESALNARDDSALTALLRSGPGLDPAQLRQSRQQLRQQFPDATWRVRAGTPLHDGRGTVTVKVSGTRVQTGSTYRLDAQQTLVLQSDGSHLTGQTLLSESSLLRSGEKALPVVLQIPDAVLTGQRYDVDLIVEDPLDGALVAGGIAVVSPQQVAAMQSPSLELGALGGGGLFKTVRAPQTPGSQTWAVMLVHPQGVVTATKRVRVVADRRALDP